MVKEGLLEPGFLGIVAFPEGPPSFKVWWEWALVAIIGVSALIGVLAFIWYSYRSIRALSKFRKKNEPPRKPSSFGVYLGMINIPATEEEIQTLSQWDAIVLDYCEPGVLEAVHNDSIPLGPQIIARLDLLQILSCTASNTEIDLSRVVYVVSKIIRQTLRQPNQNRYFTSVLVAGWRERVSTPLLNGLAKLLSAYGLDVYLEVGPPTFLDDVEKLEINLFSGLIVRNGTIMPNGERRDYFEMDKMKTTTKAFVSQATQRPFITMMWDTIDDDADLSHAVVRRAHMWCNYHGAVPYLTRLRALTSIEDIRSCEEPLAAFQWLKTRRVMNVHEKYRTTRTLSPDFSSIVDDYLPLQTIFPLLGNTLASLDNAEPGHDDASSTSTITMQYPEIDENGALLPLTPLSPTSPGLDWKFALNKGTENPLSSSFDGSIYGPLGCFPIGLNASKSDFDHVIKSQRRLRNLKLLGRLPIAQLHTAATVLNNYCQEDRHVLGKVSNLREAILSLADLLGKVTDDDDDTYQLQVYSGLDSGFHTPTGEQFWSVWEIEPRTTSIVMYISKSVQDITGVLLHTHLSRLGFSRYDCFLAEYDLSAAQGNHQDASQLPQRLDQDLQLLSSTEILLYLQHLQYSEWEEECPMLSSVQKQCEELLIEVPTYRQFKKLGNMDFISGTVTDEHLVNSKLKWYRLCHLPTLDRYEALELFRHIYDTFQDILWWRDHDKLDVITSAIEKLANKPKLDSFTDFVLFCIFCAARKAGFEEVYIEVSDRNPLFNQYTDQSAAFAELFALGSRCEAYFDIKPSDIGLLLSKKHRDYYNQKEHQPPMWIFNAPSFASAYAAAQTDIEPNQKASVMPAFRRFTFLSVFAIPALKYATLALMCSLLLSGAIGTWISIGGTYYLISMAFSAANMFVLTRLIGGLAFTLAGCLLGFIVIAAVRLAEPAAVFFIYLFGLTAYLTVLAVLSTYQIPGSTFLNGRRIIIMVVPTLTISPLLTIFISGYDIYIYPCVLYIFVILLILGTRHVATQWVTWYHDIKTLNDADVKDWYTQKHTQKHNQRESTKSKRLSKGGRILVATSDSVGPSSNTSFEGPELFHGLSEPAILALCRKELYDAVMKEKKRYFWHRPTEDSFVKTLADCWDSTLFLLDWYCRITDTKRPIPYSSTWNLETQVALESMQQSQKGIKLHNSFIHWRNAGDEIYCGILYFLVALMDRWVALVHGNVGVSLSIDINTALRLSVGFGLAYYLIGAVLLDYKAQHLHTLSEQMSPVSIEDIPQIKTAKANDQKFRRHLYLSTLYRFTIVHVWALALCAALIFIFNGTDTGLIMFLAYVGSYSGLLLYQYNKIFSGPHALMPLLAAVVFGFIVGNILYEVMPDDFLYDRVIGLAVIHWSTNEKYHAYTGLGSDEEFSQSELQAFCDKLKAAPKDDRFRIMPTGNPGDQINSILLSCTHDSLSTLALNAFPTMPFLVQKIVLAWKNDLIKVFIVPMQSVVEASNNLRAISAYSNGHLTLYVASDSKQSTSTQMNVSSNCMTIAETLLHACSATMFGMPHYQAEITESMPACRSVSDQLYTTSESCKRSMPALLQGAEALAFETASRKGVLRNLCLGYDCDTQWDILPLDIRRLFLRRCLGIRGSFTNTEMSWINANVLAEDSCSIFSRVARYDLGALLAVNKYNYFRNRGDQVLNEKEYRQLTADIQESYHPVLNRSAISLFGIFTEYIRVPVAYVYHLFGTWAKFFFLACMADPEFQRELNGALIRTPPVLAKPATFVLTGLWIYSRAAMSIALPFFLYHRRKDIAELAGTVKGSLIIQKKNRLLIRSYGDTETAFVHSLESDGFKLVFYQGILQQEPSWGHTRVTYYDTNMRITLREEYKKGNVANKYTYEYSSKRSSIIVKLSKVKKDRVPMSRNCIAGDDEGAKVQYNHKGHLESGSYISHGNLVRFKYHYRKNAKYDDELLRAEFVLPHMSANVSWCAPPVRHAEKMERWIPTPRVHEATFVQGPDVYECSWLYDHKFHPSITTTLNGESVDTPDMIRHDWLGVLKKPTRCTFTDENPLLAFKGPTSSLMSRIFRNNIKQQEISTSRARSQLWKAWKKRNDLDGVVIRWVDEELIRKEALLRPYWRRRDRGSLLKAEDYLALHADAIMASSDLTSDISAWTPLAIRMSDLFSFGQGGDAVIFTRTKTLQRDTDRNLHVIAVDTGTWPNEGGGVSACRRDLINNLRTIKWHMVVESANDFGLPKHQTEENVESLKVIPLWGLDFMHPSHGMFTNKLDSEVDHLVKEATISDIKVNFIPTLTALIRGARAISMTSADVKQATRALVNLNTYFQDSRHWKEVWTSDIVKDTWRKLWLDEDMPNAQPPSEWFRTELPTLGHFDTALELWFRYFFNPGWEVEIGSAKGQLTHRNVFKRKVDPIVNGITDMQKFSPVTEIKTKSPTVTMLSHVWFAKDIKTALLAADIISNEWGFKDYKLDIYGALNKSPVYSSECQEILACKGLGGSVALKGTADPAMVLENTWLFLNSSVSEGLPLALGEAALTGAPVVCTDVGASLRVLTDPDDGKRYSEVVAPNDAYGLARAQINLLAMLDEWAQYADDDGAPAPILPHKPTARDVEIITKRMYDKTEQRRKLGMMARSIVQKSFGGERYLREHEQMLWIGKACYEMLGLEKRVPPPKNPARALSLRNRVSPVQNDTASSNILDLQLEKMQHPRRPYAERHHSTATSFSSVNFDQPSGSSTYSDPVWEQEEWDHNPDTPASSLKYPKSENSEDAWQPITRPLKAHSRGPALPILPTSPIARGKRPAHHPVSFSDFERENYSRSERNASKLDPRRTILMRQSLAHPESGRSSLRTRSHLNEMEIAEYGNVDGRL
ncbi:hypothetical protein GQ44DRAFT_657163 [Phaeosphaeriaceae sp. PMI808]|nr:hypothetical protein GQ44DRAFT_657163 [Phaeosphaeriaceae sp. PMI808]